MSAETTNHEPPTKRCFVFHPTLKRHDLDSARARSSYDNSKDNNADQPRRTNAFDSLPWILREIFRSLRANPRKEKKKELEFANMLMAYDTMSLARTLSRDSFLGYAQPHLFHWVLMLM